jgi:hypothetical protein
VTTNSYPAVGNNGDVNDAQQIPVHAIGDGIVEDFGFGATSAFSISVNDGANTITLTPGKVRVAGYVGEGQTETLSVPTVGSTTVYSVAWCYDPALNVAEGGGGRSALGPVRLQVVAGALSTTGGKRWVVLYTITRAAAQALSLATRVDHRRWVGSAITMPTYVTPTTDLPRGTQILETSTGETRLRDVNAGGSALEWRNITAPTAVAFPLAGGLVAYLSTTPVQMFKFAGCMVGLRGIVRRANNANLGTGAQVNLGTLPAGWRPSTDLGFNTLAFGNPNGTSRIGVDNGGLVSLSAATPGQSSVDRVWLDGIIFRAGS